MPPLTAGYRLSIAARLIAAVVGGYVLTSQVTTLLALYLPLSLMEATLTATMLSFAIYAAIVLTAFAMRSVWRMTAYLALALVISRVVVWIAVR
jgi:hypothetical protein